MVTAVGFNSASTCAAMRARVSGAREANLWDAPSGSNIAAARVPLIRWWVGPSKLVEVIAPALAECLQAAAPHRPDDIPVLLGVPSPDRAHRWSGFDERILAEVQERLGTRFHPDSRVLPRGNVSGVVGLRQARTWIAKGVVECCIVAGVDSYLEQPVVDAYAAKRRVLTPVNSNGFIPGEAGTAILVTRTERPERDGLEILGIGLAKEKAIIDSEQPSRAEGLIEAVGQALREADLTIRETSYRITDLNGEHYKFKEASFVQLRYERERRPEPVFELWHPHEFIGEIGAAYGPCILGWALQAARKQYAPGTAVLCHFSNDDGERAAVVARYVSG
jgi:3-oxoacyl-[acyl-carrier-protein] synthase-1